MPNYFVLLFKPSWYQFKPCTVFYIHITICVFSGVDYLLRLAISQPLEENAINISNFVRDSTAESIVDVCGDDNAVQSRGLTTSCNNSGGVIVSEQTSTANDIVTSCNSLVVVNDNSTLVAFNSRTYAVAIDDNLASTASYADPDGGVDNDLTMATSCGVPDGVAVDPNFSWFDLGNCNIANLPVKRLFLTCGAIIRSRRAELSTKTVEVLLY